MIILYIYFFYISIFFTTNSEIESIENDLSNYRILKLELENSLNQITNSKNEFQSNIRETIQKLNEINNLSTNLVDEVEINNLKNEITSLCGTIKYVENTENIIKYQIDIVNCNIQSAENELSEKLSENIASLELN